MNVVDGNITIPVSKYDELLKAKAKYDMIGLFLDTDNGTFIEREKILDMFFKKREARESVNATSMPN